MGKEKKEPSEERRGSVSSFLHHFSLRRKTVANPTELRNGQESSSSPHHLSTPSPTPTPVSWNAPLSSGSVSTSVTSPGRREVVSGETTAVSVGGSDSGGKRDPSSKPSRLQRATSMIRRGPTARKAKDEPGSVFFSAYMQEAERAKRDDEFLMTTTKKKRNFFGLSTREKDGEQEGLEERASPDPDKAGKRQSLILRSNKSILAVKSSAKDEGIFGKGEPGYFIKELKKHSSATSTSSSKRNARGNRLLETLEELKEQLPLVSDEWVQEFVREPFKGAHVLIDVCHDKLHKQTGTDLSVQAACLECLRILANNAGGLAQLMNSTATKKIASLLASRDAQIKSAALELLSFVCLMPPKGVSLVLEAMNNYRLAAREPARFQSLVQALRAEEKNVSFLVNALFFINSLVNSPEDLKTRFELRREFISLGLLDLIKSFKETWALSSSELKTQLKVFEEEMQHDLQEEKRLGKAATKDVDRSNPEELFQVVYRQVRDSPYYQSFTNTLVNMLQLSATNAGQQSWQAVEAMLSQYLSLADREGCCEVEVMLLQDLEELKLKHERKLRNLNNRVRRLQTENAEMKEQLDKIRSDIKEEQNVRLKEGISRVLTSTFPVTSSGSVGTVAAGEGGGGGTMGGAGGGTGHAHPGGKDSGGNVEAEKKQATVEKTVTIQTDPTPLPPPLAPSGGPPPPPGTAAAPPPPLGGPTERLPPKKAVHPSVKLKHLNWTKIPATMVSKSFWSGMDDDKVAFDRSELEQMFAATSNSPRIKGAPDASKAKQTLVTLIDMKRANNCAIMLSRFKATYAEIKKAILELDESALDYDKVMKLMEFAPTKDEIDQILDYPDDKSRLGKAEQFFWEIRDIRFYSERLKAWAFKLKCREHMDELRPDITAVIESCDEVQQSKKFRGVLEVILAVGNYINGGTHRGAAYGFKLDALTKLQDTKSADNKTSLLQYIVQLVAQRYPDLIGFPKEIKHVHQACRVSFQIVKAAVEQLRRGFNQVKQAVAQVVALQSGDPFDQKFTRDMQAFLESCREDFNDIESDYREMEESFEKIVEHFGEPISSTPEQLFGMIHTFTASFERSYEEYQRKTDAKSRLNSRAPRPNDPALGGRPHNIDDVVNQLKNGALFRQRRQVTDVATMSTPDKGKEKGEDGATTTQTTSTSTS